MCCDVLSIIKYVPLGLGASASPEFTAKIRTSTFLTGRHHSAMRLALTPHSQPYLAKRDFRATSRPYLPCGWPWFNFPSLTWQRETSELSAGHRSPGHWWIWCICQRLQKTGQRACSQSGSAPAHSQWLPRVPGHQTETIKSCLRMKNKWIDNIQMGRAPDLLIPGQTTYYEHQKCSPNYERSLRAWLREEQSKQPVRP